MRGDDNQQEGMFSYVFAGEESPGGPSGCGRSRKMVDEILKEMSPQFAKLYSTWGGRR